MSAVCASHPQSLSLSVNRDEGLNFKRSVIGATINLKGFGKVGIEATTSLSHIL